MKVNKIEVGRRIYELRTAKNLSMSELANKINVSGKSTVNEWEKGRTLPNKKTLRKLADFLGVDENYILFGSLQSYVVDLIKYQWKQMDNEPNELTSAIYEYLSRLTTIKQDAEKFTMTPPTDTMISQLALKGHYIESLLQACLPDIMKELKDNNISYEDEKIIQVATRCIVSETIGRGATFSGEVQRLKNALIDISNTSNITLIPENMTIDEYVKLYGGDSRDDPRSVYESYYSGRMYNLIESFKTEINTLNDEYKSNVNKF
ncbi:helix-turn-helix domain-containing protein [Lapidilactobacillus bayanensis]|uniref:helix-turn-helix domain-containing protein n=1 Tax=Lapidilactobacillus bayanensis TaxID=2485998 RepID=UPI000F7B5D76|nr:helix-turn-helix transcriptional regulator [Lapidilactobacillus bayanensis]